MSSLHESFHNIGKEHSWHLRSLNKQIKSDKRWLCTCVCVLKFEWAVIVLKLLPEFFIFLETLSKTFIVAVITVPDKFFEYKNACVKVRANESEKSKQTHKFTATPY